MKILAYTWNTNGIFKIPTIDTSADIYVISLQECLSLPMLDKELFGYSYRFSSSFCGLQTIVLGKFPLKCKFTRLALGPLYLPNKGCISTVINGSILHINAHLSAHPENQAVRMDQIKMILELIYRPSYETVIFTGDFNFRMIEGKDQSFEFIEKYPVFEEMRIDFKPTFKYDGHNVSTKRTPSYCDRIYVFSRREIHFNKYASLSDVILSDHKPVYCEFDIRLFKDKVNRIEVEQRDGLILFCVSDGYQWLWKNRYWTVSGLLCILVYLLYTCIIQGLWK